jgi:phospholipase C
MAHVRVCHLPFMAGPKSPGPVQLRGDFRTPRSVRSPAPQRAALLLTLVVVVGLSGCGGTTPVATNSGLAAGSQATSASIPQVANVVLVLEENHSYPQVIGNSAMPFLNKLATDNALATQYFANAHPSLPDYFMLTTGQLITLDDSFPGPVADDNLVRELVAAGKSWKSYAESLPSVGYTGGDQYPYARRHNPFAYFTDVIGTPQAANLVPFSQFSADLQAGKLPNFSFVAPNLEDDAHDCPGGAMTCTDNAPLSAADSWLQQNIAPLLNDPNFQKSGLLIVVFDEGLQSDLAGGGGHVAMVMAGTGVKKGFQSSLQHDHAAVLRLIMKALGVSNLPGAAATAGDMAEFF